MSAATPRPPEALPEGPLVGFYGDDFTGSTAVMEVLAFAGLPTVLFLDLPTPERLAAFRNYRGIGIAGIARSQTPAWMSDHLPPIYRALAELAAPLTHYKVCSTFDSAPHVGSIGRAVDLAVPILGGRWHPLVVGAPANERYQVFGNLFAAVGGKGYRLDRHPTMARHPVTPMGEADLGRHLAGQTDRAIGLVDFTAMKRGDAERRLDAEITGGAEIVALDVLDGETLAEAGRLMWERRGARLFAVGSQGVEYALVAYWKAARLIDTSTDAFRAPPVDRIACVSGSCSPVTAEQIHHAAQHGFATIPLDAALAVDAGAWQREVGRAGDAALVALGEGRDPLCFTAAGPDDPAVARMGDAIAVSGQSPGAVNDRVGAGLGQLLERLLREGRLTRAAIAGGDTSGHATSQLGVYALTALAPMAPGAPLCRAHSDDPALAGLEISLKGGQMGAPDFFCAIKRGGAAPG